MHHNFHLMRGRIVAPVRPYPVWPWAALLCALPALAASAQTAALQPRQQDKYHVTAQEKAACSSDAIRFCMHTYPDEDQLLACMKQNRDALTESCRIAFDAGVRRRRL